ncbi:MAG: FMN-binding protein [Aedoeadaptatus pacaensis]|uniref:FMN-binding protein n=1 Tax=Aedoeadaptatus pacaensis TaxID=1776390 RepID=UPI0008386969|nr:FMN-binding protein [Peptoniphilus pacaensis]
MKKLAVGLVCCLALTGCGSSVSYSAEEPVAEAKQNEAVESRQEGRHLLKDGSYVSAGRGMQGDIQVELRVRDGYIDRVDVVEHNENVGVAEDAFDRLEEDVLQKQSADVDTISGATEASYGFMEAVRNCIRQAE